MKLTWPSTSRAEDAATWALADLTAAAGASEYRVIGGNMTTFHGARHPVRIAPRATSDADAGIESSATAAANLVEALSALDYTRVDGSRFARERGDLTLIIDLLVPDVHAERHNIEVGPLSADAAPGLTLALSRPPEWVDATVILTTGEAVTLRLPLPDSAVAVVLKVLAWEQRLQDKDAIDAFRLLDTWAQDLATGQSRPLRRGVSVRRVVEVLRRSFVPPSGKVLLLPAPARLLARRLATEFTEWASA